MTFVDFFYNEMTTPSRKVEPIYPSKKTDNDKEPSPEFKDNKKKTTRAHDNYVPVAKKKSLIDVNV